MLIDLSGEWSVRLDPACVTSGAAEGKRAAVRIPGILQAQGYGNPITRETPWISGLHDPFWYEREEYQFGQEDGCSVPFLAQPPLYYVGQAWYEREFTVSEEAAGEVFFLLIELTKWRTAAWVDGERKGSDCSLCTAHQIEVGPLTAGVHTLTVCVDNRFQHPYRPDGHGVSDALGASWNGMAGEVVLLSESERRRREEERKQYAAEHPRHAEVRGGRFFVDGHPEYFRGTHFGGDYPLTGCPSVDPAWWRNLMKTVKDWGLNFIRCHSYCPPEAAFAAADEAGVYIQPECGMWNVFYEGKEILTVLKEETERILRQFGHHPSFVLFSPTNEPDGEWYGPLKRWVAETRTADEALGYGGRRLYTAQSGWFYDVPPKDIAGTDYIYFHRSGYGPILGGNIRNYEGWRGKDYAPSLEGARLPVICHEMGQWCAYPDFSVMEKFTGYLRPGSYLVFRENARAHGVLEQNRDFAWCSGKNQVLMYKEDIEANLRTPHLYGFEMLDLHDYLGQGTALVGVLDPFWESKGYVRPEEFREFCGETVVLARIPGYVYKNTDRVRIPVEICHFGREALENPVMSWKLSDGEGTAAEGSLCAETVIPGSKQPVGEIGIDFSGIHENTKLTLTVKLTCAAKSGAENRAIKNHWDLYVYRKNAIPTEKAGSASGRVVYTREWSEAKMALAKGLSVVFSPYLTALDYDCPALSMRPVFWNAQMGPNWSRSVGLAVEESHPVFKQFPTEHHGGWQWEEILAKARGFHMDRMPKELKPVVTAIDDWNRNLPLSLMLEGKVGEGRLLMVTACLEGSFEERPAAYCFKQAILAYAASEAFDPKMELTAEAVESHLSPLLLQEELGTKYLFDEDARVREPEALGDLNPNRSAVICRESYPITITMAFKRTVEAEGISILPDQKDRLHEGGICRLTVQIEVDGGWKDVWTGRLRNSSLLQKIGFERRWETNAVRLIIFSSYGTGEKTVWRSCEEGWYQERKAEAAMVQATAVHVICGGAAAGSDEVFWDGKRKSTTKEIED